MIAFDVLPDAWKPVLRSFDQTADSDDACSISVLEFSNGLVCFTRSAPDAGVLTYSALAAPRRRGI